MKELGYAGISTHEESAIFIPSETAVGLGDTSAVRVPVNL